MPSPFTRKRKEQLMFTSAILFGFFTVCATVTWGTTQNTLPATTPAPALTLADSTVHTTTSHTETSDVLAFAYAAQRAAALQERVVDSATSLVTNQIEKAITPIVKLRERETVTLRPGQNMVDVLRRFDVPREVANAAVISMDRTFSSRKLRAGQQFTLFFKIEDGQRQLKGYEFTPNALQRIVVAKDTEDKIAFNTKLIEKPLKQKTFATSGIITTSLAGGFYKANVPQGILSQVMRTFSYSIDFQRDIHEGTKFDVMYDAKVADDGKIYSSGDLIFARFILRGGKKVEIYRYTLADGSTDYFHADGSGIRRGLLKTPISGVRVTSGFGFRRHPVLGYSKMHEGIDFGARTGTPIYAAGDGVVQRASWFSSYGNYVKIQHNGNLATAYGHMSRYATGIRPGIRVKQGQVIGYVGTTGRSTGAHLHYEVHIANRPVNPLGVKVPTSSTLAGRDKARFAAQISEKNRAFASLHKAQANKTASR